MNKKKVSLRVIGRTFDVSVDEKFASYLENQMEQDFNKEGNNEITALLQAYIKRSYELYEYDKKVEDIIKSLP